VGGIREGLLVVGEKQTVDTQMGTILIEKAGANASNNNKEIHVTNKSNLKTSK
jgi:hypothetical protein